MKHLTRNINGDMSTMNYVDDVNIDDVSDAETVTYTATPKRSTTQLQPYKIKKSMKILNEK